MKEIYKIVQDTDLIKLEKQIQTLIDEKKTGKPTFRVEKTSMTIDAGNYIVFLLFTENA